MLEDILRHFATSTYDFRENACPEDPLADHWIEWIPYYRMKAAITAVLRPESIFEIGVRYGYSAAAFLHGAPRARYTGIDLDVATYGGTPGAIEWARRTLPASVCTLEIGDSQRMSRLPGEVYDLVHVDGQQDGDGTWHDLDLAAAQGRWLLVDGYFWSRPNMLAATEWLLRNRDIIEWSGVIPNYGGELLVKLRSGACDHHPAANESAALACCYTSAYYLEDCGGHEVFRRSGGRRLEDARLRAVAALAGTIAAGRVLDLGCGRGELTYYFAQRGCDVTAVDYAPDAIALARSCFADGDAALERVRFICGDVNTVELDGSYDIVVVSDLIEHLAEQEIERLYARVAKLAPHGTLIVHTFPNLWHHRYHYPRIRRRAATVGTWLPPDPRSRYERLMHINEQSPRVLRRQLARHFRSVHLWFGDPADPAGTLVRPATIDVMRSATDLFAVAACDPIDRAQISMLLRMDPLALRVVPAIRLQILSCPTVVSGTQGFTIRVALRNDTDVALTSFAPAPVHLSYHWLTESGAIAVLDGRRTPMLPPLTPRESAVYMLEVDAPPKAGDWLLQATAVQEGHFWFEHAPGFVPAMRQVRAVS